MRLPSERDILAAIDALGKEQPKRPTGNGWKTINQMAHEKGISRTAMQQRFRLALERGLKVERFVGSDVGANGSPHKQTWWRVKR